MLSQPSRGLVAKQVAMAAGRFDVPVRRIGQVLLL
jgi:hypothetical protein